MWKTSVYIYKINLIFLKQILINKYIIIYIQNTAT